MDKNITQLTNQSTDQSTQPQIQAPQPQENHSPQITSPETKHALEEKMSEMKRRDRELETNAQARNMGIGYVNLENININPEVLKMIPQIEARQKQMVCFFYHPYQELRIASPQPNKHEVKAVTEQLSRDHHTPSKIFLISHESLAEALKQYELLPKISHIEQTVEMTPQNLEKFKEVKTLDQLQERIKNLSATEMINLIVGTALLFNASDIHLETEEHKLVIRYRLDGLMHHAADIDYATLKQLSSRIKLLSKMKINISDRPQDGHFIIEKPEGKIDVRVSTLPTNYGESIVMRILRSDIAQLDIKNLGLNDYNFKILNREIKRPNGMLIASGPTGSGKTTTLYAILGTMNKADSKILTIEDPIEYTVPGINQSQVNKEKGYTFVAGLKSLVRQDPDTILVGEMRDEETVKIAINAALTGHLVLSTLHTNDAAGAIPRFLTMGAKPYLLAPALNTIIAQRLVRLLCTKCRKKTSLLDEYCERIRRLIASLPEILKKEIPQNPQFFESSKCDVCHGLGFKGRTGIFEIFVMTPELEKAVLSGDLSAVDIKKLLAKQGMISMAQDGILKAIEGKTTINEIFRVVEER